MPLTRIVSLDGGGQLELTSSLLLAEIEKRRPGFLARTQVFAGTSAGAMAALVLASRDDPSDKLAALSKLWEQFDDLTANSPLGTLLSLFGLGPVMTPDGLRSYLSSAELLGDKRLGDLRKLVVVPSFQLNSVDRRTGSPTWRAKIFDNFGTRAENPDHEEDAVSVCLRSGAAPVFFPIADNNFIDGGAVANNPAVIAVAKVLYAGEHGRGPGHSSERLADMRVLSVGVGKQREFVSGVNPNWGYLNWMFNPTDPLLLVEAFSNGSNMAIDFECQQLLGGGFHRLNPFYATGPGNPRIVNTDLIKKSVASPATQTLVEETLAWLDRSSWMEDDPPVRPAKTARKARTKVTVKTRQTRQKAGPVKRAGRTKRASLAEQ
jgi:uncharacterized protein